MIIDAAHRANRPVFVIGFAGHVDPRILVDTPHVITRPGRAGTIVRILRRNDVKTVVMAGAIRRPSFTDLRPDWYTARFLFRLGRRAMKSSGLGDDGLLRAVARQFEKEGFKVAGAADLVAGLTIAAGPLGSLLPNEQQKLDIAQGVRVVRALGLQDVGQAAVVQQGMVLGVEALEGTDELIARCAKLARSGAAPILVKLAKPQQDLRLDMPTIGPGTVAALAAAKFAGAAVQAGRTILLDPQATIDAAEAHSLFVTAIDP